MISRLIGCIYASAYGTHVQMLGQQTCDILWQMNTCKVVHVSENIYMCVCVCLLGTVHHGVERMD